MRKGTPVTSKTTGKTWWGRRFLEALEAFTDSTRLARGKPFAQRVRDWSIQGGKIEARVRGRANNYFGVHEDPVHACEIELAPIPDTAWDEALGHIGGRAGFVCRLLFNEMPDEIERPFSELGLSLLPRGRKDAAAHCACQDTGRPCEHIAGVYHLLASKLDYDPFLLFELRGLSRVALAERLKATPMGAALAAALTEDLEAPRPATSFFHRPQPVDSPPTVPPRDFWRGAKRLPQGVEPPQAAALSGILIRKGGDHPPFWDKELSFVEAMDDFYEQVRKQAKEWM